jgi:hypothetical protein
MNKQTIKQEIKEVEDQLVLAENTLRDYLRTIPVIVDTRYVRLQVTMDVFKVKSRDEAELRVKGLNSVNYCGHNDWVMPTFADCYLLKGAIFNWYGLDKATEFLVEDSKERTFCPDATFGWISNHNCNRPFRLFLVRAINKEEKDNA